MVAHTQFSRDSTSANRKKLWDPSEVLGVINTDPGYNCITCVGYAPSQRRRCRNAIRADNRAFITETLNDISYLPPDSPAVISRLRAIAGPALCVRWHQDQDETVVKQWQRKIQQLKPQLGDRKPTKSVQSSKQKAKRDESVEDLQEQLREMREMLAKFREEASSKRREEQAAKDRQEERKRRSEEREKEARRQEKKRLEKERLERQRLEKEREEREENLRREREQAAQNERIRQRAQKRREEREREMREKEKKEREEWDQLWTKYQQQWAKFRTCATREGDLRDTIPWPVKSGSYQDVKASNVKEFLEKAVPREANMAKLMRKECQKWHPDTYSNWLGGSRLGEVDKMMVDMICRVVTGLLNDSAGRSAEFLG